MVDAPHPERRSRLHHEAAKERIRSAGMADSNRDSNAVRPRRRPHAGADRGHEGFEPTRRTGSSIPIAKRHIGEAEAQEEQVVI